MANTTNFGWETPDDTDLVKDGALAMRTLGNAIDTSLVDLKGGTTGQVLSKASNTDLDYTWTTPNVGDITEVQAGTGISVASGTGPIPVVTNTVATTFDAKGDLVVGTGADTFAKLTVGTNGYNLVADSSTSTGLKWAAAASSSGPAFEARRNGNQTVTASTQTKIEFNQEDYDTDNCFDSTTNYRFTPNKAGYYQINLTVVGENSAGSLRVIGSIYKNGSVYSRLIDNLPNLTITQQTGSSLIYFNGTTDYVEGYVSIGGTSGTMVPDNGTGLEAVFSGVWIRS